MNGRNLAIIGGIAAIAAVIAVAASVSDDDGHITGPNGSAGQKSDPASNDTGRNMDASNDTGHDTQPATGYEPNRPREWLTSGPFQIDRSEYALGENIFFRINNLGVHEKGQAVFLRTLNDTHYSVYAAFPFDGQKPSANTYFTPDVNRAEGICSVDDIAGQWVVAFRGTDYPNLRFTISDSVYVPGEEDRFEAVC